MLLLKEKGPGEGLIKFKNSPMKKIFIFISLLFLTDGLLFSQIAINRDGTNANASAILDIKSDHNGFLPPRMTIAQRDAIQNPAEGLMVFCTDCDYNNSSAISMFKNGHWRILAADCPAPQSPLAGLHIPSATSIIWSWNATPGATGYKWNYIDD